MSLISNLDRPLQMQVVAFADFYTVRSLLLVDKSWCEAVEHVYNRKAASGPPGVAPGADDYLAMARVCPPDRLRKLLLGYHPDPCEFLNRTAVGIHDVVVDNVVGLDDEYMGRIGLGQLVRPVRRDLIEAAASAVVGGVRVARNAREGFLELDEQSPLAQAGFKLWGWVDSTTRVENFELGFFDSLGFCVSNRPNGNFPVLSSVTDMTLCFSGRKPFVSVANHRTFHRRRDVGPEGIFLGDADVEPDAVDLLSSGSAEDTLEYLAIDGRIQRGAFPLFWQIQACLYSEDQLDGTQMAISLKGLPEEPEIISWEDRRDKKYVWVLA